MQTRQSLAARIAAFILALAMPLAYAASQPEQAAEETGAQGKAGDTQASQGEMKEGGIGQAFSDATATASIKTRLAFSKDTDANNIHVTTTGGKVVLEGDVASTAERDKASEIARNTNGVTEVQNKLNVAAGPESGEGMDTNKDMQKPERKENQG